MIIFAIQKIVSPYVVMDYTNFDNFSREYNTMPCKQGHFLMPKWPFRMIINGPSGCGKSNLLFNMLTKWLYYDKLFVFAKNINEDKYEFLREFIDALSEKRPELELVMSSNIDDVPSSGDFDKEYQNLVVFDDFVLERDQSKIESLFMQGRKDNISTIYLSQSYHDIPKFVRSNANYVALFGLDNEDEVKVIRRKHGSRLPMRDFMKIYHDVTDTRHQFLLLDNITPDLPLAFRKGFDGILMKK